MSLVGASAATTIIDGATDTDTTLQITGDGVTVDISNLTIQDADNTGGGVRRSLCRQQQHDDLTDVALIGSSGPYVGAYEDSSDSTTTMTDVTGAKPLAFLHASGCTATARRMVSSAPSRSSLTST